MTTAQKPLKETAAQWLGLNRATVAVLVVIGCLGLSEEVWSNFLALHLNDRTGSILRAAEYTGLIYSATNLLEGFGYIIGGRIAHSMGARLALAISAVPMSIGFMIMLAADSPWAIAFGSVLMTNWEPLSVPATFDIVGSEVPKNRRTIAFAVQSIQKRLPKVIGPAIGAAAFAAIGYWLNLTIAFGLVGVAVVLQLFLTNRMQPKGKTSPVPFRTIMRDMPRELRMLLSAEVFIRWGDWFVRGFSGLYVLNLLITEYHWEKSSAIYAVGWLVAITNLTALATYIPIAKLVDRSKSPRPFIGLTFLLFAVFPVSLVMMPRFATAFGLPVIVALGFTYVVNGLRELGEPARKALIANGFPPAVRARAVGLYWGLRSFAFFPAPLVAGYLWARIGPDATFVIASVIGLMGTAWYAVSSKAAARLS